VTRRKKGRDKRRSDKIRHRKQDLPILNVRAGQPIQNPSVPNLEGSAGWSVEKLPSDRSLEDAVGVMYVSRKAPKIEKVSLKDFEQEFRRGKEITRRRRASSMRTVAFYELQLSKIRIEKYRQYEGEIYFAERQGAWYITLADLLTRIGPFEAEITARTWAQRYLGRKYFKGEGSD